MSKRFSLGRSDAGKADILLPGDTISARHAEILVNNDGALLVCDMGSSNGTAIIRNGKQLAVSSKLVSLFSSDILALGGRKFTISQLLEKLPKDGAHNHDLRAAQQIASSGKMMRCQACGSVTPQGKACIECGSLG